MTEIINIYFIYIDDLAQDCSISIRNTLEIAINDY